MGVGRAPWPLDLEEGLRAVAVGLAECGRRWSAAGRAGQEPRWVVADGGGEEKAAAAAVNKVASAAVPPEMG